MKNLLIIFNRLESHPNFNDINISQQTCANFMYEENENEDVINGFSEEYHQFARLIPNKNIIESSFSSSTGFNGNIEHSEILLIHVKNNIESWNENFRKAYSNYTIKFDNVYVSYHENDLDSGNHELIEEIIDLPYLHLKTFHHHEYEMDGEKQLYGCLAKAIIYNKGYFNKDEFDRTLKELISFFPPDEEIQQSNLLNQKLTFLHKLLGGNITQDEVDKKMLEFGYVEKIVYQEKDESIREIRDLLLEGY